MVLRSASVAPAAGLTRRELAAALAEVVGAPHEARFIVEEAVGDGTTPGRSDREDGLLPPEVVASARAMAARRAAGEPLQYVFGHWSFRCLDLLVDRRVLIPRPETEQVVEVALREARRLHGTAGTAPGGAATTPGGSSGLVAVDVGTGSGAIALSLATELAAGVLAEVWAVDASADALAVAATNLDRVHARERALPPVSLVEGEWLSPLPAGLRGTVGLVVSNPPYVSEDEWAVLAAGVRAEPRQALVSGPARDGTPGLAGVEAVLFESRAWLARPGAVVIELAPHQAGAAVRLARRLGYADVCVEPDLAGRARTLVVRATAPT
jgi:release factor glutamine methyltransferase